MESFENRCHCVPILTVFWIHCILCMLKLDRFLKKRIAVSYMTTHKVFTTRIAT